MRWLLRLWKQSRAGVRPIFAYYGGLCQIFTKIMTSDSIANGILRCESSRATEPEEDYACPSQLQWPYLFSPTRLRRNTLL